MDAKLRLIRWMLLLQEFNLKIRDKKGAENTDQPWFADICNFLVASTFPPGASRAYKVKLESKAKYYVWDDPYLWRFCNDQITRRCISDVEFLSVLHFCHSAPGGDHYGSTWTTRKVLDCGFYWPTIYQDTYKFVSAYEQCQRAEIAISRRNEMPQHPVLICEIFYVCGIDFMGPFPISNGYSYILLIVEAIATRTNDAKVVVDFLKFGMPKALISDQGTHFCNRVMSSLLEKYGVIHKIVTPYHLQTNDQAEVFNREIKKTIQKMANPN
ncbi:Pro-Pol polyprotein, partial [Mucuna pruriens]